MEQKVRELLNLMHSRKEAGKILSGAVCIEAIRKKFPDLFENVENLDSIIKEADDLLRELSGQKSSTVKRKRPSSSEDERDDSTSEDSSSCESDSESCSDDDSDGESTSQSSDNEDAEANETEKIDKNSLFAFMKRAGIASQKKSGETDEEHKSRLIEICKENDLDHEDTSKKALKAFLAKQELKALQEEADITLSKDDRKGRNETAKRSVQMSCSSLVDE